MNFDFTDDQRAIKETARDLLASRFKLERVDWERRRRDDIVIENLEPCLPLFGAFRAARRG